MGPNINPSKNNKLSNLLSFSVKAFDAIPLIPTNLPLNKKNITSIISKNPRKLLSELTYKFLIKKPKKLVAHISFRVT